MRRVETGACARVQRFSVGCEGGTSITRYMGRGGGGEESRGGKGAGKSSRAANCPPSYPPYTLSHTLTVTTLIPLPPWSPPPAGSSSHPCTQVRLHPPSPILLHLPPRFLSTFPPRYRLESFRLPTPYKRSCCPFITTTLATGTRPRPPPSSFPFFLFSFLSFLLFAFSSFSFSSSFSLLFPFSIRPRSFIRSFVSSFLSNHPSRGALFRWLFVYFFLSYVTPTILVTFNASTVGVLQRIYREKNRRITRLVEFAGNGLHVYAILAIPFPEES